MAQTPAPTVALVPLRSPGKNRLADTLAEQERDALSRAMLADVAAALRASPIDRVVVAASGTAATAAARALDLAVVTDPPATCSLDAALQAAGRSLGRVGTLLVVMADLPRLHADDVAAVLATDAAIVVAATADGGTGGLLRRPPGVMGTAYGPGSAARHRALARAAGVGARTVDLPGFRHDVDAWGDLSSLPPRAVGPATGAVVASLQARLQTAG